MAARADEFTITPRRREPWDKARRRVVRQYPSAKRLAAAECKDAWIEAFGGPGPDFTPVFAKLMGDLFFKYDDDDSGRPGPRPQMDFRTGQERMRQLLGEDYTTEPFWRAVMTLLEWKPNGNGRRAGRLSLTTLARKTGLDRNKVYRLVIGVVEPTGDEMEAVAKALGKHPSYFAEWRTAFLTAQIVRELEQRPDSTMGYYRDLVKVRDRR